MESPIVSAVANLYSVLDRVHDHEGRASQDEAMMLIAVAASMRATCPKRAVGAVIVDQYGCVVGTGYNGVPRRLPHCDEQPCGAQDMKAPESHQHCLAVHAESNALISAGHRARGGSIYCTLSPCRECSKLIVNAGITKVFYLEKWRLHEEGEWSPKNILEDAGVFQGPY